LEHKKISIGRICLPFLLIM